MVDTINNQRSLEKNPEGVRGLSWTAALLIMTSLKNDAASIAIQGEIFRTADYFEQFSVCYSIREEQEEGRFVA